MSIYNIKGLKASTQTFQGIKGGVWAQLLSTDMDTSRIRDIVEEGIQVRVGNGKSTLFWHDNWCSGGPLKYSFNRLFSISLHPDALISQMGIWRGDDWVWKFNWRRRLYEWEEADAENLLVLVSHVNPQLTKNDDCCWKGGSSSVFPIKEIGDTLYASYTPILTKEVSDLIWRIKVPPRAHLILWLANLEKLKTGDTLVDRGVIGPNHGRCPFCDIAIESNSHILFSCSFSWRIWMEVLLWWGVSGALHNRCAPFSLAWRSLAPVRCRGKLWLLVLGCVIWSIWFERNRIKFQHGERDMGKLLYTIKVRVGVWAKELLGLDISSIPGAIHNVDNLFP